MDHFSCFIRELNNRDYARNTITAYARYIRNFLEFSSLHKEMDPCQRIANFLESQSGIETRRIAWSAIHTFYKLVLKKPCPYKLEGIRSRKRIPVILSKDQIDIILKSIQNKKHKTMITLLYGSGLRVSEVVNLRCGHIDFNNSRMRILNSKQKKDRLTMIPKSLIPVMQDFCNGNKASDYVFRTNKGKPYCIRTVQTIFTKAVAKAGLSTTATCHSLRHSFATHLLDQGVHIKHIKSLLGHSSLKTTFVYLHASDAYNLKIPSPIDIAKT